MKHLRSLGVSLKILLLVLLGLFAGPASADPLPVGNPNGMIKGTIDGHALELPVLCETRAGMLTISSHDQTISNSKSIGEAGPAVSLMVPEKGFQFVAFIDGERYKFRRSREAISAFPYTLTREVRAGDRGKIDVDFTLECPAP